MKLERSVAGTAMAQSEIASVPSTLGAIIIVGAPISEDYSRPSRSPNSVLLRQDFIGGVVVIGVAPFAFWQSSDLPVGSWPVHLKL